MAAPAYDFPPAHTPKYRIYRDDELHLLPKPEWTVRELVPHHGFAIVFGFRGDCKTFFLLALLFYVATGRPFFGRNVRRGWCVYVGPEGAHSLHRRLQALQLAEHHKGRIGIAVLPQAIQLLNLPDSIMPLANDIEALEGYDGPPAVICIDTLSRNAAGAKENAQEDMSLIVSACDYLRHRFKCTVILAHHTRKGDDELRGSSVLDGAADTCILLKKDVRTVTVSCVKQKDAAPFESFGLELESAGESMVLRSYELQPGSEKLTSVQLDVLQCLADISTSEGCSTTKWCDSMMGGGKVKERTFYTCRKALLTKGYVNEVRGGKLFAVSPSGTELLQLQSNCNTTAIAPRHGTAITAGGRKSPVHCTSAAEVGDAWEAES